MATYKLSASLEGHEDDVRSVVFPNPNFLISASRDATVRVWKLLSSNPPSFDGTLASHGTAFINSVAFVPPSKEYPEGLIVSGGKDTIIEVRQPGKAPQDNADALLLGHAHNVCALDVSEDGRTIVSGGWDAQARVWSVGNWETTAMLEGHQASVWAVLAYDKETVITGCADKMIRVFNTSGKLLKTIRGSPDVVRALCRLPANHPSKAHFASAGNDAVIRLWTLDGREVAQLHGHESFIYSLAALPDGQLISSSEDRTARIWKGTECTQTITHPAISVWSVAVCPANGDIVTGASDRFVRVFSRDSERQADADTIQAFESSVQASSIPQQQVGNINREELPGPEFLTEKSGTKEGQVQMIKERNGNISAYQWSTAAQQWINIGTVVDSAGSSGRKINFQGKDYDYVFDVDIEDGKPPLKLPYNLSDNPYEVARKFIEDNELPITYLDQVTNFIISNTKGATLGQSTGASTQAPGTDPWGTESRYRPGEVGAPAPPQAPASSRPRVLPQTQYLSITNANIKTIVKKIEEFNGQLLEAGSKDVSLNPSDLEILSTTAKQMESSNSTNKSLTIRPEGADVVLKIATLWPPEKRLPGLDLLRLLAAVSPGIATHTSSGENTLIDKLELSNTFSPGSPLNNAMLAIRVFANLFNTDEGRLIADGKFEKVHELIHPYVSDPNRNRNLIVALTTLYINYAVLLTAPTHNADRALTLLDDLTKLINTIDDSEALYRALVAAGTLLALGQDFRDAAKEVFDFEKALARAEKVSVEPRIKNVIQEMRDELS